MGRRVRLCLVYVCGWVRRGSEALVVELVMCVCVCVRVSDCSGFVCVCVVFCSCLC